MTEAAIEAIRESLEAAENRGDPSVQLERRADEGFRRMPPGRPPMDRAEADDSLRTLYEAGGFAVEWESDGVVAGPEVAVDSGRFRVTFDDGGQRTGNWLLAYRRDDEGEWRIVRDIYNYDD